MENQETVKGKKRTNRKNSIKGTLFILILCSVTLLLAGFKGISEKEDQSTSLKQTLPLLTSIGKSVTASGTPLRLVVKWQGDYNEKGSTAFVAASKLSSDLGLGELEREDGAEHLTYRSKANQAGFLTRMFWSELEEGHSYVIVTLETTDALNAPGLLAAAEETGSKLQVEGITAEWNTSLQGIAKEQGDPQQAILLTEKNMNQRLQNLELQERYEDATTVSQSYDTSTLLHSIKSGDHKIAIQTAIHQDINKGGNRITIGLPVITIEY